MIKQGFWHRGSWELRWLVLRSGQVVAAYRSRSEAEAHHG